MNLHQPINYRMHKDMTCMKRKESSIVDIHARTGNDDTSIKLLSSRYIRNMNKYPMYNVLAEGYTNDRSMN